MFNKPGTVLVLISMILIMLSCSGGDRSILQTSPPIIVGDEETTLLVSGSNNGQQEGLSERSLLSFHVIYLDPVTFEHYVVPTRGVTGHWNVLKFLEYGLCTDCVKIVGMDVLPGGELSIDLEVTHPLDNPYLTFFDCRGIAMFHGSKIFPAAFLSTPDLSIGDGELVNAQGYTTLYNYSTMGLGPGGLEGYQQGKMATAIIPDALLNGYRRLASDFPANTRQVFLAGDSVVESYIVDMPDGPFIFGYAIDTHWAEPTIIPVNDPITDFPVEANCPEPWKIAVHEEPVGEGLTELGGQTRLFVDVYDWQGKASHYGPFMECPDLFDGAVSTVHVEDFTGYTRYESVITNSELAVAGDYEVLISVEDTENDSSPTWLDLSAYQIYAVTVNIPGNDLPVAIAEADPDTQTVCEAVHFTDNGSYDPDGGDLVTYEWDWDNDGLYDETGDDVYHQWDIIGYYNVQFRVTDDEGSSQDLDVPFVINIENALPTAELESVQPSAWVDELVQFDASGSHDNDCDDELIIMYEWDWENDGTFTGGPVDASHSYSEEGVYEVNIRVTDDEGGVDELDWPVSIEILFPPSPPKAYAEAVPTIQFTGQPIHFMDDGSYDPDGGPIQLYEWDWDNNGTFDEAGDDVYHSWSTPGIYYVQFKVTDDEGYIDLLDEPIEITVQDELTFNLENVTPEWLNFSPSMICKYNDYLITGSEVVGVHFFDITDPLDPVWIKKMADPETVVTIDAADGYLYAVSSDLEEDYDVLHIIDIDPVETASVVNTVELPDYTKEIHVEDGHVYIVWGDYVYDTGALVIVDVEPYDTASIVKTVGVGSEADCLDLYNGHAFVLGSGDLNAVDIDPIADASVVNSLFQIGGDSIDIIDGYASAAGGSGITLVDVDPVESMQNLGLLNTFSYSIFTTKRFGNFVLALGIKNGYSGSFILTDFTTPNTPEVILDLDIPGHLHDMVQNNDLLYVAAKGGGIQVLNIETLDSPEIAGQACTPGSSYGIEFYHGYAWIIDSASGIDVVDISIPESATVISHVERSADPGLGISFYNDNVLTPEGSAMSIWNITNVMNPVQLPNVPIGDCGYIAVQDQVAFVSADVDYNDSVALVDLEPIDDAYVFNIQPFDFNLRDLVAYNGYLYSAQASANIVNIYKYDPIYEFESINIIDVENLWDIDIVDETLYIADRDLGLVFVSITNPETAAIFYTIPADNLWCVDVENGYAYACISVEIGQSEFRIYDILPYEESWLVASLDLPNTPRRIFVHNGYAFIACNEAGLQIISLY